MTLTHLPRRSGRALASLALILPLLTVSAGAASNDLPGGGELTGQATVTDGDTLRIGDTRVRLLGLDAPEKKQTCHRDGQSWTCGEAATDALKQRVGNRNVTCTGKKRDRYGRFLANCRVGNDDLALWMISNGWALAHYDPDARLVAAEQSARSAKRGVWATQFTPPWDWRKTKRGRSES